MHHTWLHPRNKVKGKVSWEEFSDWISAWAWTFIMFHVDWVGIQTSLSKKLIREFTIHFGKASCEISTTVRPKFPNCKVWWIISVLFLILSWSTGLEVYISLISLSLSGMVVLKLYFHRISDHTKREETILRIQSVNEQVFSNLYYFWVYAFSF